MIKFKFPGYIFNSWNLGNIFYIKLWSISNFVENASEIGPFFCGRFQLPFENRKEKLLFCWNIWKLLSTVHLFIFVYNYPMYYIWKLFINLLDREPWCNKNHIFKTKAFNWEKQHNGQILYEFRIASFNLNFLNIRWALIFYQSITK